jgi:hypothetical protein
MAATPKGKPNAPTPASKTDRTSTVVGATLILLTVLGVVTVFWEPLAALAVGAPPTDTTVDTRAAGGDAGAPPSVTGAAGPVGGALDGSSSS